jgi:hypothetical protein
VFDIISGVAGIRFPKDAKAPAIGNTADSGWILASC